MRQFLRISPHKVAMSFLRDAQLFLLFGMDLIRGGATNPTDLRAWR